MANNRSFVVVDGGLRSMDGKPVHRRSMWLSGRKPCSG